MQKICLLSYYLTLKNYKTTILKEFQKYSLVNILVFLIDIFLLFLLTEIFNIFYLYSATISIVIGFTINYTLNINWVFKTRRYLSKPLYEYFLMIIISLIISGLNIVGIWLLSDLLNIYYLLSKVTTSLITFIIKFALRKKILFQI